MKNQLIKLTNVSFTGNKSKKIIENINLTVNQGEIITIIGPNGTGKTTLARLILGVLTPSSGEVFRQKDLVIGYVPQKINFDSMMPLSVTRFIQMGITSHPDATKLVELLEEFNLTKIKDAPVTNLSGGEIQKMLLVKALITNPSLLLLDEPTQGIDLNGQADFYRLVEKIRDQRKISILMISHDLFMVMKATDHVICLNHHICCEGEPSAIMQDKIYQQIFPQLPNNMMAIYTHNHDHEH